MRLKLFRAATMSDAMRAIRSDLGPDALILSSRRTAGGMEVTAALGEPAQAAIDPAPSEGAVRETLAYHGVPQRLAEILARGRLQHTLLAAISFRPLDLSPGDPPTLFAGPPGAGKTFTVARLATRLVMSGQRPMVVTADGQRAGAVEQLAAFTRLLGLDLIVASNPASLARALARRTDGAPVLVDMPGGCGFDRSYVQAVCTMAHVGSARIAVILPAGMDVCEAGEVGVAYAQAGARSLVVTRLDVARRIGCVISAASAGLALAELGVGPNAADGLVTASPEHLAARLGTAPDIGDNRA